MTDDWLVLNRANWDSRAPLHAASPDYNVERAVADPSWISGVVAFDRPLLGGIAGLEVAHLQCHIGTDTLSLARLGARVTGLDFSAASLAEARRLAERAGADIDYVEAEVYAAPEALGRARFDLVYTGIGSLGWLPSIDRWAAAVAGVLKPGGRLFIREGHPVLWSVDDARDDLLALRWPYFETGEPTVWDEAETYVTVDAPLEHTVTHQFNHGLGEIVQALIDHGMRITGLVEHRSIPWMAIPGQMTWNDETGEASLTTGGERMPLTYTLQAVREAPTEASEERE